MFKILQILTAILIALAFAMALAHALELPGKMRLTQTENANTGLDQRSHI